MSSLSVRKISTIPLMQYCGKLNMNISSELYCEHTRRLVLRRQNVYGSVNSKLTSNGIELEVIENLRCGHSLTEDQDQAFVMTSVFILIFQCTLVFMAR